MATTPSEVRAVLKQQHEALRMLVLEAERVATDVLHGTSGGVSGLLALVQMLHTELAAHVEAEENLVVPWLREADAWAPARVQKLQAEHEAQLAALNSLSKLELGHDTAELARGVRSLCRTVLEDMRREDREMLGPDLLRDDVVAIDQIDG